MIVVKKHKSSLGSMIVTILGFALLFVFVAFMLGSASDTSSDEALKAVRDSVVRAVISCYAYEGFYPDSIEYLTENYMLNIDENRYLIYYDKIADNIMPNIIVTRRGEAR
jgi:hypothetical protein